MDWQKKGLIYCPKGEFGWNDNTFLTPTPFLLNEETIRIYGGMRDKSGISRIGYVDVRADNPSEIIQVSKQPVLDTGIPGGFDDNGLILGDVIRHDDKIYMYYVGFQLVKQAKFLAFSGLAISHDNGESFERVQPTAVMDRTPNALYIRAIHSVLVEDGIFKVWYSVGCGWELINGAEYPQYDIRYTESKDGIHFPDWEGISCVKPAEGEYRIGRPRVRRIDDKYEMRFTYDTLTKDYRNGIAHSDDGIHWTRLEGTDLPPSGGEGWDSIEVSYPCILKTKYGTYAFYDGNGMGQTGFGYAELKA